LIAIGEKAETTHSLFIVPTATEYWLLTTFPRERWYRQWWLATHRQMPQMESFEELATKFPNGLSEIPELPEERSGEVSRLGTGIRAPLKEAASRGFSDVVTTDAMEEELV
jgi:hypothetical protein